MGLMCTARLLAIADNTLACTHCVPLAVCFQGFARVKASFQLMCSAPTQAGLQRVQALVKQRAGMQQQGRAVHRGPLLASAELELRRLQLPPAQELGGLSLSDGAAAASGGEGLAEAVLQCFTRFGHLSSCAADVRCGLHHCAAVAWSAAGYCRCLSIRLLPVHELAWA